MPAVRPADCTSRRSGWRNPSRRHCRLSQPRASASLSARASRLPCQGMRQAATRPTDCRSTWREAAGTRGAAAGRCAPGRAGATVGRRSPSDSTYSTRKPRGGQLRRHVLLVGPEWMVPIGRGKQHHVARLAGESVIKLASLSRGWPAAADPSSAATRRPTMYRRAATSTNAASRCAQKVQHVVDAGPPNVAGRCRCARSDPRWAASALASSRQPY